MDMKRQKTTMKKTCYILGLIIKNGLSVSIFKVNTCTVITLLQFSEKWPSHTWLVDRMNFASFRQIWGGGRGRLIYPILLLLEESQHD